MKTIYFSLLIIPFLWNCANENTTTATQKATNTSEKDTLASADSIKEDAVFFDMHPTPEIESIEGMVDAMRRNLQFFSGKIGEKEVSVILIASYISGRYDGRSIYQKDGTTYKVDAEMNELQDTVIINFSKDSKKVEKLIGKCNEDFTSISGIWIKENDTLDFQLEEQINSAEKIEIFKALESDGELFNTKEGIALKPSYANTDVFNSFMYAYADGEGADFGEYWINTSNQIFFEDSIIIYLNTILENTVETVFKDGYQPSGPDDYDSDKIEGEAYSTYGSIEISVIKNGIIKTDTINIDEKFNTETWLFKNYIILKDTRSNQLIRYKWDREKETYFKQ